MARPPLARSLCGASAARQVDSAGVGGAAAAHIEAAAGSYRRRTGRQTHRPSCGAARRAQSPRGQTRNSRMRDARTDAQAHANRPHGACSSAARIVAAIVAASSDDGDKNNTDYFVVHLTHSRCHCAGDEIRAHARLEVGLVFVTVVYLRVANVSRRSPDIQAHFHAFSHSKKRSWNRATPRVASLHSRRQ